jgi:hypothetical protein
MPPARERTARHIALPSTLWALGAIAIGCVYPELSTSPDWRSDSEAGAGADAGSGGSNSSGTGGRPSAGSSNEAGAEPGNLGGNGEGGEGGEGGAPGPDIIHATVVDPNGEPIAGVPILIDDLELETDANGEASTPGQDRASFRATLVIMETKSAFVYEGLTRRELYFMLPGAQNLELATGTLQGTITMGMGAENLQVAFVDGSSSYSGLRNVADMAPNVRYDVTPSWPGGTLNGSVLGLNWVVGPGMNAPSSFAFGSTTASLTPNATVTGLDFALLDIATRELAVSISTPAGATRNDFLVLTPFNVTNLAPPASLTYHIPDDDDFDALVSNKQFLTSCTFGTTGANSSVFVPIGDTRSSIDEACPSPPELTTPADMAKGVKRTTPLVFTPSHSGCNSFYVSHLAPTWNVAVFTLENEVVLPDLSAYGLDYTEHDVSWTASTSSPCHSIDDYATPPTGEPIPDDLPATSFSRSAPRLFTTAP